MTWVWNISPAGVRSPAVRDAKKRHLLLTHNSTGTGDCQDPRPDSKQIPDSSPFVETPVPLSKIACETRLLAIRWKRTAQLNSKPFGFSSVVPVDFASSEGEKTEDNAESRNSGRCGGRTYRAFNVAPGCGQLDVLSIVSRGDIMACAMAALHGELISGQVFPLLDSARERDS
jgi:hypothetical protein